MLDNEIQARLCNAIIDYLYEEGGDKITVSEAVGILELAKFQVIEDQVKEK